MEVGVEGGGDGAGGDETYVSCGDQLEGFARAHAVPHCGVAFAVEVWGEIVHEGGWAEDGVGHWGGGGRLGAFGNEVLFDVVFCLEVRDGSWSGVGFGGTAAVAGRLDKVAYTVRDGCVDEAFCLSFFNQMFAWGAKVIVLD